MTIVKSIESIERFDLLDLLADTAGDEDGNLSRGLHRPQTRRPG